MALKRGIRQLKNAEHCARKRRHETQAIAEHHARTMISQGAERRGTLNAYRCLVCSGWHLGNRPG